MHPNQDEIDNLYQLFYTFEPHNIELAIVAAPNYGLDFQQLWADCKETVQFFQAFSTRLTYTPDIVKYRMLRSDTIWLDRAGNNTPHPRAWLRLMREVLKELRLYAQKEAHIPLFINEFINLESIEVSSVAQRIHPAFFECPALRVAKLHFLSDADLSPAFARLPKLERLEITVPTAINFPKLDTAPLLRSLRIQASDFRTPNALSITENLFSFAHLESLELVGKRIEKLPENLSLLPRLERLQLCELPLAELPPSLAKMPALRVLEIKDMEWRELPQDLFELPIEELHFEDCTRLRLSPEFRRLRHLKKLTINGYRMWQQDPREQQTWCKQLREWMPETKIEV